jgi:hypothetical protein
MHHFNGHHGGRVFPAYRDSSGETANIAPRLLGFLNQRLGSTISIEDFVAYVAAVTAHPYFTERFYEELSCSPGGVHIPLTSNPVLWREAVAIGERLIWIHTYGERYVDIKGERPFGPPHLAESQTPRVMTPIVNSPESWPREIRYEEESRTLWIDSGSIMPVSPKVWNYRVLDMFVVRHWFSYRCESPGRRRRSKLDQIRAPWSAQTTESLLELLNLLDCAVEIEPIQKILLDRVLNDRTIDKR